MLLRHCITVATQISGEAKGKGEGAEAAAVRFGVKRAGTLRVTTPHAQRNTRAGKNPYLFISDVSTDANGFLSYVPKALHGVRCEQNA